ncbi:uncharacterized protein LOC134727764 [Mytilus trossulus]|uniref:uncharacterized protein LOC134727764 n=1 Tax=Mytilus trossulus TaxID=6551 RepID=UPI003005A950
MMGVFKMLMLYFILFTTINGFLLDSQQSNGGQSLPSNQYMTLSKFYEEEKRLQLKMENLHQDTFTLRHDMDNSFVLLTAQLQHKLDLLDMKLADIEKNNVTNEDVLKLEEKNKVLEQNYKNLQNENTVLQNKYNRVENDYQLLKNKTKYLDELLLVQTGLFNDVLGNLSIQGRESTVLQNKSILMDQEISKLKQLGSIQPLKEIKTLQQSVQTITAQTNSLSMKERARSQDFLALYNMTTNSLNELEVRTHSKINQLENITLAQLHDIEKKSEETENLNNLTFSRIQQQINESTEQVAMTAHPTFSGTSSGIMKFDDVSFSIGINNLAAYKNTGKFICERKGLYIISSSIMSHANLGDYYIMLNDNIISETRVGYSSSPPSSMYHTGTIVLALQLHPNDSVWVHNPGYYMNGGLYSTLTIVKVK